MKFAARALLEELMKQKLITAYQRARRAGFAKVASKLSAAVLDDVRLAATDELAKRGVHVIAYRPRPRKVA